MRALPARASSPGHFSYWASRIRRWLKADARWPGHASCRIPIHWRSRCTSTRSFTNFAATGLFFRNEPRKLVAIATQHGFPLFVGSGTCFRAWAMLEMGGSIEEAISTIQWGLATKRATGEELMVPYYYGLLAEAHRRANRIADGISLLHEALELVERTEE